MGPPEPPIAALSRTPNRAPCDTRPVPTYRVHDTTGDDLGTIQHPAPNVEPSDVVILEDGRDAIVTSRVETYGGPIVALLEVAAGADADSRPCCF